MRTAHPEFIAFIQQLAGNFIGHCTLSTVDPAGLNARQFRVMCESDSAQLRLYWEAMPNPPNPDDVALLADETRANMLLAAQQDAADAGNVATEATDFPVPVPPGPIKLM